MKKIAVINIKGGVGKTISTVNIGAVLAKKNNKVLIVDLDPQGNASQLVKSYGKSDMGISNVFLEKKFETQKAIIKTEHKNIDIISANINFAFAESKIITDTSRQQQFILRKALEQIEGMYDYCLIDCPPNIGVVTINALTASDQAIVPIKIDQFALDGLDYLLSTIFEIKEEFNPNLNFLGSFITMDNNTSVNKGIKEHLNNNAVLKMFETSIKTNVKVPESTFNQMPVVYTDPKAAASIGYNNLTEEILKKTSN